jgi:hypothetical protein
MKRGLPALLAVVVAGAVLLAGCNGADKAAGPAETAGARLATRSVKAGEVDVKVTPARLDDSGAAFEVVLDTHAVELDMELAKTARLEVDGTPWTGAAWEGAGPGGHHREGTLSFDAVGPATGRAVLTIEGLPAPVEAAWDLAGGS